MTTATGNVGVTGKSSRVDAAGASSVGSPGIATPGIGMADVASGSSTGGRGMSARRAYAGPDRRLRHDPAYQGPERRLAGV